MFSNVNQVKLPLLFEAMPDAIFFKDSAGRWKVANQYALSLFGLVGQAWQNKTDFEIGLMVPALMPAMMACTDGDEKAYASGENGTSYIVNEELPAADGSVRSFEVRKVPIFNPDGSRGGLVIIGRDVTERIANCKAIRESESNLRESKRKLRALSAKMDGVRESAMKNIAMELHDELGQVLNALRLNVLRDDTGNAHLNNRTKTYIELIDRANACVRGVVTSLRPPILDAGIVQTVEWQCRDFTRLFNVKCKLNVFGYIPELDDVTNVTIFRIIQEALTNVAKHAHATLVTVSLSSDEDILTIVVSDNGVGFNPGQHKKDRFGLLGMNERAISIGGRVDVMSYPNDKRIPHRNTIAKEVADPVDGTIIGDYGGCRVKLYIPLVRIGKLEPEEVLNISCT